MSARLTGSHRPTCLRVGAGIEILPKLNLLPLSTVPLTLSDSVRLRGTTVSWYDLGQW